MINLPDDIQYLIWKSYFSHHILSKFKVTKNWYKYQYGLNRLDNKYTDEIVDQWYKDDCPPAEYIYEF